MTRTDLLDGDGENRALRTFLALYLLGVSSVGTMARHMELSGWDDHPAWTVEADSEFLTKAGAQLWIRHLLALESRLDANQSEDSRAMVSPLVGTAPERIYLQVSNDSEAVQQPFPADHGDITWSTQAEFVGDVEYVRADLVTVKT